MMAYQMGHLSTVWDPAFGDNTRKIITSDISKAWPVADSGLGAISYMLEALSGMMGDRRRWRTMPWMVAMFSVLVIPLGGVSIYFIMIQPVLLDAWCFLCLITAAAMVIMLPYSFDEIVAMFQFLKRARQEGQPLWQVFWHGGTVKGATLDPSPPLEISRKDKTILSDQVSALPKALTISAALGVWLVIAPWALDGGNWAAALGGMIVGGLLIVLALPRGPVRHQYA